MSKTLEIIPSFLHGNNLRDSISLELVINKTVDNCEQRNNKKSWNETECEKENSGKYNIGYYDNMSTKYNNEYDNNLSTIYNNEHSNNMSSVNNKSRWS